MWFTVTERDPRSNRRHCLTLSLTWPTAIVIWLTDTNRTALIDWTLPISLMLILTWPLIEITLHLWDLRGFSYGSRLKSVCNARHFHLSDPLYAPNFTIMYTIQHPNNLCRMKEKLCSPLLVDSEYIGPLFRLNKKTVKLQYILFRSTILQVLVSATFKEFKCYWFLFHSKTSFMKPNTLLKYLLKDINLLRFFICRFLEGKREGRNWRCRKTCPAYKVVRRKGTQQWLNGVYES